MNMFKKVLIAIITNSQEDLCTVSDIAQNYTKSYRISVINDKKEGLVMMYIRNWKIKRLVKKINDNGYELIEQSKNCVYQVKKVDNAGA